MLGFNSCQLNILKDCSDLLCTTVVSLANTIVLSLANTTVLSLANITVPSLANTTVLWVGYTCLGVRTKWYIFNPNHDLFLKLILQFLA